MSKALIFGMAAVGGMAMFAIMSRFHICNCVAETELGGGGGKSDAKLPSGVTCNEKMCGPREGEVLKGERELTVSDEQWRKKLPQGRHIPLHLLRHAAVRLRHEVRRRHRLAELLEAYRRQGRR